MTQTQATLSWQVTSTNEDSFTIIRWAYGDYGAGQPVKSTVVLPARSGTGPMTWTDTSLQPDQDYGWSVAATLNGAYRTPAPYVSTWTQGPVIPSGTPAAAQLTAFENDNMFGVFSAVDKASVVSDLISIVSDPEGTVYQGQTGMCGPAAIEVELARRNPAALVNDVRSIYETGQFAAGSAVYAASQVLESSGVNSTVSPANWLFMATLTDSENLVMRISDQVPANSVAWITLPGQEVSWIQNILGFSNVTTYTGNLFTTIGTYVNQAANSLASGGVVFLLIDSSMVGNPPWLVPYPNHYVDLTNWSPNSPNDTFTVVTWGAAETFTVPWQEFNADTFEAFAAG